MKMFRTLLSVTVAISSFLFYIIFININDHTDIIKYYSSVWCHYDKNGNKFCTFSNLCFRPESGGQFVFSLTKESTIYGLSSKEDLKNISLSSVEGHNGLNMKIVMDIEKDNLRESKFIRNPVVIISRFKADNTMHVIHDDIFPLFMTYHFICAGNVERCSKTYRLAFLDNELGIGPHSEWYNLFSVDSPLNLNALNETVCFKNLHTGLSRESLWFQYGFKRLQGPILTSSLNGLIVSEFRNFILKGFNIVEASYLEPNKGVFISRKLNRKILNEDFVIDKFSKVFNESSILINDKNFNVHVLDSMQNSSKKILETVHNCRVLVGMHGSAMIYSLFLPQGAAVLELFPFAIQPKHVSPVRALADLLNMKLSYLAWRNLKENNSVAYPRRHALLGGLEHLHPDQQVAIKAEKLVPAVECCHNPLYLYRMFQDTVVDNSFTKSLLQLKSKQNELLQYNHSSSTFLFLKDKWVFPGSVYHIECKLLKPDLISVTWKKPLNIHATTKYEYLINIQILTRVISITTLETNITVIDENAAVRNIQVWIKCVFDNSESIDSFFVC